MEIKRAVPDDVESGYGNVNNNNGPYSNSQSIVSMNWRQRQGQQPTNQSPNSLELISNNCTAKYIRPLPLPPAPHFIVNNDYCNTPNSSTPLLLPTNNNRSFLCTGDQRCVNVDDGTNHNDMKAMININVPLDDMNGCSFNMGLKLGKRTYYAAELLDNAPVSASAAAIMTTPSNYGNVPAIEHISSTKLVASSTSAFSGSNATTATELIIASRPPLDTSAAAHCVASPKSPKKSKANNNSNISGKRSGKINNNTANSGLSSVNNDAVISIIRCQSEGCDADLSTSNTSVKDYHRRHRVCAYHAKASLVRVAALDQRFCQQCSRFHVLGEFDDGKRSCRRRLAGHNERRRKPPPEPIPSLMFQPPSHFASYFTPDGRLVNSCALLDHYASRYLQSLGQDQLTNIHNINYSYKHEHLSYNTAPSINNDKLSHLMNIEASFMPHRPSIEKSINNGHDDELQYNAGRALVLMNNNNNDDKNSFYNVNNRNNHNPDHNVLPEVNSVNHYEIPGRALSLLSSSNNNTTSTDNIIDHSNYNNSNGDYLHQQQELVQGNGDQGPNSFTSDSNWGFSIFGGKTINM